MHEYAYRSFVRIYIYIYTHVFAYIYIIYRVYSIPVPCKHNHRWPSFDVGSDGWDLTNLTQMLHFKCCPCPQKSKKLE